MTIFRAWLDSDPHIMSFRSNGTSANRRRRHDSQIAADRVKAIENELLDESMGILRDTMRFQDIEPDTEAPPDEWVKEMGAKQAMRSFRVAKSGWESAKNAPVAIKCAQALAVGILKNRSLEKAAPVLNAVVQINIGQQYVYPEKEVFDE